MDQQSEYLKAVGMATLQQQLAAQEQKQPRDAVTEQRIRNQQILADRRQRELEREIAAAREKDAKFQAQRQKDLEDQQQIRAIQLESEQRQRELANWKAANLPLSDFERWWEKERRSQWQAEQASGYQEALRQSNRKRLGGSPF